MQYGDGRRQHHPWSAADSPSRTRHRGIPPPGSAGRSAIPPRTEGCGREEGIVSRSSARAARIAAVTALAAAGLAACGVGSTATPSASSAGGPSGTPIRVGMTVSLTGDFAADGQAALKGYQLWRDDVNRHGGLLGRPVQLVYLDDKSNPAAVTQDYTALIAQKNVNLLLGPFSSVLTVPAAQVAHKYGYAIVEGSGTAPAVYNLSLPNVFGVSPPVATQMVPFANWVASLPVGARPKTAAYAMVKDPFADPPLIAARTILEAAGVATVYNNQTQPYPASASPAALAADADKVAAQRPQVVLIGSVDVPTVSAFINEFKRLKFNRQMLIAAAGPDQGLNFLNSIGSANASGIMVPNGWYGGFHNALSHVMVQEYISKYGGTASAINADVAEAYAAGQAMAEAVENAGLDQSKIMAFLHSGAQVDTVQGPAAWAKYVAHKPSGQNTQAESFIFQWQPGQPEARFVQVLS